MRWKIGCLPMITFCAVPRPLDESRLSHDIGPSVLGVGSNNFSTVMEGYVTRELQRDFLYTVHNKYLLCGLRLAWEFTRLFSRFYSVYYEKWRAGNQRSAPGATGSWITAGSLGYMVHQTVTSFTIERLHSYFWFVAGLLFAIHDILRVRPAALDPFSSIT